MLINNYKVGDTVRILKSLHGAPEKYDGTEAIVEMVMGGDTYHLSNRFTYMGNELVPQSIASTGQTAGGNAKHLDGAVKFDTDKIQMELIPPELLEAVGTVLTFGAKKYDARNWEQGMDWSRCFGALMRHMWSWWSGDSKDPETGESHLWHAGCCIAFLIAYEARSVGNDDRPEK